MGGIRGKIKRGIDRVLYRMCVGGYKMVISNKIYLIGWGKNRNIEKRKHKR
jgi:hypothetical protein